MKALVFGAGRMGQAVGYDLDRYGVNVDYADKFDNTNVKCINAGDFSYYDLVNLFEKYNVVIGCAGYSHNVWLTEACIEAKTHFCDLGGNINIVEDQLALDQKAAKTGSICIPDCGLAPGMANLLAAYGIQKLGGKAKEVTIRVGGLPIKPVPPLNYCITWSVDGLINEYNEPCEIIKDGRITQVEPLADCENLTIEEDCLYRNYEAFNTSGGLGSLCHTYLGKVDNLNYKTIRYIGHCNFFSVLREIGFFKKSSTKKLLEKYLLQFPKEDKVIINVVARDVNIIKYTLIDYCDDKHSAMARCTGFSAAAVAYLLADGSIEKEVERGGVYPGETCIPLDKYYDMMIERGINIKEQIL